MSRPQDPHAIIGAMAGLALTSEGNLEDLDAASDALEALYEALGTEDVGEPLAEAVRDGRLTPERGRALLDVVPWTGRSNGAALQPTLERWLAEANDPLRVELALGQSTFPFASLKDMQRHLREVARRMPRFRSRCEALIDRRQRQGT